MSTYHLICFRPLASGPLPVNEARGARLSMPSRLISLVGLIITLQLSPLAAQEKIELLLERSPAPANLIGYVNVGALDRVMPTASFPPQLRQNISDFWLIADLNLSTMRPNWEAGYATLEQPIKATVLADRIGGYVDRVAGEDVVYSPSQAYLVPGKQNRLGILRPADRALLAGWLKPHLTVNYSEFLKRHAKEPESYLSLMLAVELSHVFSPVALAERLGELEALKSKSPAAVASTLASIEGVSLIVGRRGLNECIVRFEFSKSPAALEPIATSLVTEILERNGTAAPEIAGWATKVDGNALVLQGTVTEATLSGIMGIFSLQGTAKRALRFDESADQSEQQQQAYRTKYYFDEVNRIIETTREHESQTTGALAQWNDKRARQIDELGTLNVDPEMVQYGVNVAELLRGNALTVREGNIAAGKTKAVQGAGGYYGYGYGYNAYGRAASQRVTDARKRGNAYANYREALNQIDQLTADMRRTMTEKYQMQF